MKCSNCGNEYDIDLMRRLNTGRRVQYICPKCYKSGTIDVTVRNWIKTNIKEKK